MTDEACLPVIDALPSGVRLNAEIRSTFKLEEKDREISKRLAMYFREGAQVIVMPFSLKELEESSVAMKTLEKECKTLQKKEAQVMSALFVDREYSPLLAYCASRPASDSKTKELDIKTQYEGRTEADLNVFRGSGIKIHFDGLNEEKQELLYLESQALCTGVQVHTRKDRKRHGNINYMNYQMEVNSDDGDVMGDGEADSSDDHGGKEVPTSAINPDAHMLGGGSEHAGVAHLVHGWIQQNQPKKGLFIAGDISRTSTSLAGVKSYLRGTRPIAFHVGSFLEAIFPEWFMRYDKAFHAGCMFEEDPGPFLGRAIVYKLQGKLHKDRRDAGPSVSFGMGYYEGGEIYFPQLKAKLKYGPGEMCFSFSSLLGHWVAPWRPKVQTVEMQEERITPGRIGTVFFFPKDSLQILEGKAPNWAATMAQGAKPYAMNRRNWEDLENRRDRRNREASSAGLSVEYVPPTSTTSTFLSTTSASDTIPLRSSLSICIPPLSSVTQAQASITSTRTVSSPRSQSGTSERPKKRTKQ